MTKDLKDLIDNIYQLAMNSRDTSAVTRMVGTIHAVDEMLLVLTKERDEAIEQRDEARIWWLKGYYQDWKSEAKSRGWDCFKTKEEP
jgi:hypothetical protein